MTFLDICRLCWCWSSPFFRVLPMGCEKSFQKILLSDKEKVAKHLVRFGQKVEYCLLHWPIIVAIEGNKLGQAADVVEPGGVDLEHDHQKGDDEEEHDEGAEYCGGHDGKHLLAARDLLPLAAHPAGAHLSRRRGRVRLTGGGRLVDNLAHLLECVLVAVRVAVGFVGNFRILRWRGSHHRTFKVSQARGVFVRRCQVWP